MLKKIQTLTFSSFFLLLQFPIFFIFFISRTQSLTSACTDSVVKETLFKIVLTFSAVLGIGDVSQCFYNLLLVKQSFQHSREKVLKLEDKRIAVQTRTCGFSVSHVQYVFLGRNLQCVNTAKGLCECLCVCLCVCS